MKIAINATILDDKPTGLGIFTINIIQNLSKLIGSKDEIIGHTSNPSLFKEYPITLKKVNSMMQPKKGKLAGIMSNLELRPMYHRVESRIRGHIMVCFLALAMESFLAYKLKEIGCQTSVKDILHDVSQMKASKIRVNGEEQIVRTELQGQANIAFESLVTQASPRVLEKNTCH